MLNISAKLAAKFINPFSRKVEIRKQVPQQQQQQQSGVNYRAATKVAANKPTSSFVMICFRRCVTFVLNFISLRLFNTMILE